MTHNPLSPSDAGRKGSPSPIHISSKKRASKHVTLVTGLETFGIDPKGTFDRLLRPLLPILIFAPPTQPTGFADDLKRICASSTGGTSSSLICVSLVLLTVLPLIDLHLTVSPLTSASPKAMLSEVLVQGTHDKVVQDLLVSEQGIPRKWISVEKGR